MIAMTTLYLFYRKYSIDRANTYQKKFSANKIFYPFLNFSISPKSRNIFQAELKSYLNLKNLPLVRISRI